MIHPGRRHSLTSWIFLRLLGLVYFFAFASLAVQVNGLIGSEGILPVVQFLEIIRHHMHGASIWLFPTVFWAGHSDFALSLVCWGGAALSLLLAADLMTAPVLVSLWVLYLSLVTVGGDFLSFQWDVLLLEAGFIAIFLGRWNLRPGNPLDDRISAPVTVIWLLRFLGFRLMFMSGLVKLASGDENWRDLTAMCYHYETQPLPMPLAWLAHQTPSWFHQLETTSVFLLELFLPLLVFGPRRARLFACATLIAFQLLIMATGNYAYFNWLTIALLLTWIDDDALRSLLPRSLRGAFGVAPQKWRYVLTPVVLTVVPAVLLLTVAVIDFSGLAGLQPVDAIMARTRPFHLVNRYGLFAIMTTSRPEIMIEGSNDAKIWLAYEFSFKPGKLNRLPPVVAPHQPRLDWQLWFAALGAPEVSPWLVAFLERLKEGSPAVLALLEEDPFHGKPPRFLRASIYDYRFTTFAEWSATGRWWNRELRYRWFTLGEPDSTDSENR